MAAKGKAGEKRRIAELTLKEKTNEQRLAGILNPIQSDSLKHNKRNYLFSRDVSDVIVSKYEKNATVSTVNKKTFSILPSGFEHKVLNGKTIYYVYTDTDSVQYSTHQVRTFSYDGVTFHIMDDDGVYSEYSNDEQIEKFLTTLIE